MADQSPMKQLSAETRSKLRSTQILTSLSSIISELLQNSIDAGASQIDIGVDCGEWSCWVMDNGSGFAKAGLSKIGQDSEYGRYNSSKAYTPASLEAVCTFGFRGEALSSMADLCCLEISSRTARSRENWSVIVKAGKHLYSGPSIRWRRESPGTVVSISDAFFSVPVRRLSHPSPNKTIELIRQELEAYALVFPNVSFSFQDSSKTKEGSSNNYKSHILKIPKTHSTLAAFRHLYGRALTGVSIFPCVAEIGAFSEELKIEGFISLVGAHTKSYQFLYINRHLLSLCDLHRLIDNRFAASTFAKHAYDEDGETRLRSSARRSPRKGEKKPIYVLNLIIPVRHIDNCLEPAKSAVQLDNKNVVTSFLSTAIQEFLVRHNFTSDGRTKDDAEDGTPRKKQKLARMSPFKSSIPYKSSRIGFPELSIYPVRALHCHLTDHCKTVWKDPVTGETFIIDNRTGNSRPQTATRAVRADEPIEVSSQRRTLRASLITKGNESEDAVSGDEMPNWLQEALEKANEAFALKEPKIPSLPLSVSQDPNQRGCSGLHHACHTGHLTKHVDSSWCLQPGMSNFSASQICFRKEDLQNARVISQVDRKFIACLVGLERGSAGVNVSCEEDGPPADGDTLILIDQHAADERVRVERFLKKICNGFLCHQERSGGVEMKQLLPPVPVLLTEREASRLSEVLAYQKTFESWGFQFSNLQDVGVTQELDTEPDGNAGYTQVFVSAIPEVVSEKLLLGHELQELIKGYLGALESQELGVWNSSSQHDLGDSDKEMQWVKALRWCPRGLLDLINSKACRGAIMFNDSLDPEQCERLVKQLSTTIFPFQCAHGRPSLIPLTHLTSQIGRRKATAIDWERVV
ncbi:hypothetical protein PAXRUDRAFT_129656 [Paxillus rubicundulus Ve08.2h10]|uniref:Unplaced genomic scaffold scaffold_10, whole genome shotgun sequence n=1 Tax=Paxillus rubicundulus Ve08.2h10 TaxID=930991 RepID=A0A0D0E6D8_9AGAM|nr:hypothetical protein PAXRUDRAFT_129656 [Paxillus rubicundulus Ve08.2h10]